MKKTKKVIATLVIIAMVISSIIVIASNTSMATQNDVTVVISADSDSQIKLENDYKTLTYTCSNGKSYSFNLKNGDELVSFEKQTEENDGRYYDSYVATNISSNENLHFICDNISLGDVALMYSGNQLGMWTEDDSSTLFATQSLVDIDDVNHYQFRIENRYVEHSEGESPATMCNVDFGSASWTINGKNVTASIEGKTLNNGAIEISNDEKITLTGYDALSMEPVITVVEDGYEAKLNVDDNNQTWLKNSPFSIPWELHLVFSVRERTGVEEEIVNKPGANTTSTINLSSDSEYENSYQDAVIEINGNPINEEVDIGEKLPSTNVANYYYNENEMSGKVKFAFSTLFIQKYVGEIRINNEVFNVAEDLLDYSDRTAWLNHYSHQMVTLEVEVDKADTYNIVVNTAEAEGKNQWIGNFLWTSDIADSESDLYIGNSKLEVVQVVYEIDDKEITVEGSNLLKDPYIEYDPYGTTKSLVVPEGAMCTMRIVPNYGYQVVSFGMNGSSIITGDNISEFTFPIHKGNFHLGAVVEPVEDVVDVKSDKVKSGNIEIGSSEIDSGSVVLSVNDVEPSEAKIKGFENAAGDYEIYSYLDIDLDQVIYKGTADDVWSNRIHNLNNEATITLQLEEGIDGNNIVIVHNINDGDEYEVIEIESYNKDTNTITFKTKSFSNYAIATKNLTEDSEKVDDGIETIPQTDEIDKTDKIDTDTDADTNTETDKTSNFVENNSQNENKSNNPQTGDFVFRIIMVLGVATLVFIISLKKRRVSKH